MHPNIFAVRLNGNILFIKCVGNEINIEIVFSIVMYKNFSYLVGWFYGLLTFVRLFYTEVNLEIMVSNYILYEKSLGTIILNR